MTTPLTVQNADIRHTFARPEAQAARDIRLISHSNIF